MPIPAEILKLVERFETHRETYRSASYNETLLRRDFLDPFFKSLGWDIDNSLDYSQQFREVIHEDAIRIGGSTKAPDYSFRIGGRRIFFLEAKKPSVSIKDDVAPAYQLRRYAWSANLPISILSDFEEFAVYDTRIKPSPSDKPAKARLLYLTYRDYITRWDEIASVFSKDAVQKGSFERYIREAKGRRGTATVDAEFLSQIENWRELLAKNVALRNPGIDARDLNFAVQATIDRIVFLRICEDRGIEPMNRLQGLTNGTSVYSRLAQVFRSADDRYNSGLFHFKREKGRYGGPDAFTLNLSIDDNLIKDILNGLYYPDSPYEFSVLPSDILGQVYEKFLGSVIRLTPSGQAKVEEKPEVKKAGGVYYTPTYIVDYIIEHTVGRSLENLSPKEVSKLRILDPACGSGSFLIGAYQYLLDWHIRWYGDNDPERYAKGKDAKLYRSGESWRLTAAERKRILVNNIYGVDIDAQAVEVTKLSLLLKVLEGETDESISAQLRLFHERALPDLDGNIKCGNSLIGTDFLTQGLGLEEDEHRRINTFDWQREFPQIFATLPKSNQRAKVGGFDVVIGNPPYIRIQTMNEWAPLEVELYKQHYSSAKAGNYDIYVVFVERCMQLLNKSGVLGFILPNKFLRTDYGEGIRNLLAEHRAVKMIVDFGSSQVFGATTYTCLLFLDQRKHDSLLYARCEASSNALSMAEFEKFTTAGLAGSAWTLGSSKNESILNKLGQHTKRLLDLPAQMSRGSSTGMDEVFVIEKDNTNIEKELLRSPLFASDFGRYRFQVKDRWSIIFPYENQHGELRLIAEQDLKRYYPNAFYFLHKRQAELKTRKQLGSWYGYSAPRNLKLHEKAQIAVPLLADRGLFALIPSNSQGKLCPMASGGFTITVADECTLKPEYILGILNSKLLFWRLQSISNVFRGGWVTCTKQYFGELPIRIIDFNNKQDISRHEDLSTKVSRISRLHHDLNTTNTAHDRNLLERQIAAIDTDIDRLVYELYGLTDDEISIIEESTRS